MGAGTWTTRSFNASITKTFGDVNLDSFATSTNTTQVFKQHTLAPELDPKGVVRECCETEEHPNTIPIILGLDVTGSMSNASKECIAKLDETMTSLYEKFKDVEFAVAGIGDFSYDRFPFQLSQFESDIRILDNLFKIYIENGGGANSWESYTSLWYAGLHHTKLDCWSRGRKGILISIGDEECNPFLPKVVVNRVFGDSVQEDVDTEELYKLASEKYDIYHIAITDHSSYVNHKDGIEQSFGALLGQKLFKCRAAELPEVITQIVEDSTKNSSDVNTISW